MAVDKAKENDFNILLLDMKLSLLNGMETLIAMRLRCMTW